MPQRVRKTTTKKTTRRTLTRRKKTTVEEPAQVLRSDENRELKTPKQNKFASGEAENRVAGFSVSQERTVEIRHVEKVPVSPYVIEFRAEDEVAETPLAPLSSPSPTPPPLTPDFLALEEFFTGVEKHSSEERIATKKYLGGAGDWASEHAEDRRRPNEVSAEGYEEGRVMAPGVPWSRSARHQGTRPHALEHKAVCVLVHSGGLTKQRPGASERDQPPAPPKIQRAPVLWSTITRSARSMLFTATKKLRLTDYGLRITIPLLRATTTFAVIALIFTLPATGLQAYTKLEQAKDALLFKNQQALAGFNVALDDPEALKSALGRANTTFIDTKADLEGAVGIFGTVLPLLPRAGSAFRSSTLLLSAGTHLTEAGRIITDGLALLADAPSPLGERLLHFEESLRAAFPLIRAAEEELSHTKPSSLPAHVRDLITQLQKIVPAVRAGLAETLALLPALEDFLGTNVTKRYLVVFQNPHELRPTGGFIGSFALLDLDRGEITNLEVPGGGPYDLACCLKEHVIAPEPLHLIEPHWQFHDANWFPNFPTSAEKLMWFYLKSGGPSVDGVIAMNATIVPKLLAIVGPIELPAYGRTFTAENFIAETQKIVELEYDRTENRPKAVISDLAPILIERLTSLPQEQLLPLVETLAESLTTKDIQIYSTDRETQRVFREADWTGELKPTDGDYLMVVSANIAGGKSNASVETTVEHRATVHPDGTITDEVRITKTHTGAKGDLFSGVRNVEYVRVYVPEGSSLISASGFETPSETLFTDPNDDYDPDSDLRRLVKSVGYEPVSGTTITSEHGKTAFGNWMQTDPGGITTATLTYRLPRPLAPLARRSGLAAVLGVPKRLPYTLLVQSQSGAPVQFSHKLIAPQLQKIWGNDAITRGLTSDLFTAALFER